MLDIIILAAGKGTRMRSNKPKVLHSLAGKSLLAHVVDTAKSLGEGRIHAVVGHGAELVKQEFAEEQLNFVEQKEQLGTGHAVLQALPALDEESISLILYGDVPLISKPTLDKLIASVTEQSVALLTVTLDNPTGYGRIIRDDTGNVTAIVEQKDASAQQLTVKEVNTGVLALKTKLLKSWLPQIKNENAQKEYYLTDLIEMSVNFDVPVKSIEASSEFEVMGINNRIQQAALEREFQAINANALMEAGLSLADPRRIDVRGSLTAGDDCFIDINCLFDGKVELGNDVYIEPNCYLKNVKVADGVVIKANSVLEDCEVHEHCTVGPFARLRPGTVLKKNAKVGNFVEIKKSVIDEGSKVNHLSYIGDAELGKNVNIGAGTITCNYDGVNKSKTIIKDDVFVGSNTALVAPVTVEAQSTIGAGSTITMSVKSEQLAIARTRQKNLDGWKRPTKK